MVSWHTHTHISGKFGDSFLLFWFHQINWKNTNTKNSHAQLNSWGKVPWWCRWSDFKPWKMMSGGWCSCRMATPKISWFLVLAISISEVHMTATFLAPILWQSEIVSILHVSRCSILFYHPIMLVHRRWLVDVPGHCGELAAFCTHHVAEMSPWLSDMLRQLVQAFKCNVFSIQQLPCCILCQLCLGKTLPRWTLKT